MQFPIQPVLVDHVRDAIRSRGHNIRFAGPHRRLEGLNIPNAHVAPRHTVTVVAKGDIFDTNMRPSSSIHTTAGIHRFAPAVWHARSSEDIRLRSVLHRHHLSRRACSKMATTSGSSSEHQRNILPTTYQIVAPAHKSLIQMTQGNLGDTRRTGTALCSLRIVFGSRPWGFSKSRMVHQSRFVKKEPSRSVGEKNIRGQTLLAGRPSPRTHGFPVYPPLSLQVAQVVVHIFDNDNCLMSVSFLAQC